VLDDIFNEDSDEEACEDDEGLPINLPPPWSIERRKLPLQFGFGKNHGNHYPYEPETFGYESFSKNFYRKV